VLRVEIFRWNRDFIPSKLMPVWAIISKAVHPGSGIGVFVHPLLLHHFQSAWLSSSPFPIILDNVYPFFLIHRIG
jgi:uncharacterized protein (DUF2236 family)